MKHAFACHEGELGVGFDPFGHQIKVEFACEARNGADDRRVFGELIAWRENA